MSHDAEFVKRRLSVEQHNISIHQMALHDITTLKGEKTIFGSGTDTILHTSRIEFEFRPAELMQTPISRAQLFEGRWALTQG